MNNFVGLIFLVLVLVAIGVVLALRRSGPRYPSGALPYYSRKYLLSEGELAFYHVLTAAVPEGMAVAPKVRVSDVIGCDNRAWKEGFGGRISQKHVDFVVVDGETTALILVVELDDKSHRQKVRQERDEFVDRAIRGAGIPVLRVRARSSYKVAEVREALQQSVNGQ